MNTDDQTEEDANHDPVAVVVSTQRLFLVYVLLVAIGATVLGYCLLLVLNEELTKNQYAQILITLYPYILGATSLACVVYTHMTPHVSEFKIGWTVAILVGWVYVSLSAFVLPAFWYLHVWVPYRADSGVSAP